MSDPVVNFRPVPYRTDPPVTRHLLRDDRRRTLCGIEYLGPSKTSGAVGWREDAIPEARNCRLCLVSPPPRSLVERCADACRCARADGRRWVIVRPGQPRGTWEHFYSRDQARLALGLRPAGRHA